MGVRPYICKKTGNTRFEAYVNLRSKIDKTIRCQKYKKVDTEREAKKWEKKLIREASEYIASQEVRGNSWGRIIDLFEYEAKKYSRNPVSLKQMGDKAQKNALSMVRNWTEDWLNVPAKELTSFHGKSLIKRAIDAELTENSVKRIKGTVNSFWTFGVQEGIILDNIKSPVYGIPIDMPNEDKLPEILTVDEVRYLLAKAKEAKHPWYPIWAVALMTGMRSSELYALRKENVHLQEGIIRICESWDWETFTSKSTKAGYWRTAPIADSLLPIVVDLMQRKDTGEFLLPRIYEWSKGYQALVLRQFCEEIGITSIKFHTLRACFATHLLSSGVPETTVMRIGGWKNIKTFQIYIRLAGTREKGATNELGKIFIPNEVAAMQHIASAYNEVA